MPTSRRVRDHLLQKLTNRNCFEPFRRIIYILEKYTPSCGRETMKFLIMANISEHLPLSLSCHLSLSFAPLSLPLSPSFAPSLCLTISLLPPLFPLSLSLPSLCALFFSFSLPTGLIFIVSGATSRVGTVGLCASGQLCGFKDQHQKHLFVYFFINFFTITTM